MELGQLTLADYIKHLKGIDLADNSSVINILLPSVVIDPLHSPFQEKMLNMWVIGTHIAAGLDFMHARGHVHRDLKPSNGTKTC